LRTGVAWNGIIMVELMDVVLDLLVELMDVLVELIDLLVFLVLLVVGGRVGTAPLKEALFPICPVPGPGCP
jgi:hypothetical protein